MNSKFKKVLAVGLAAMSAMACAVTGFAANSAVTVPTTDSHSYAVYQIMTGTVEKDATDSTKVNIIAAEWGQNCASGYTKGNPVDASDLANIEKLTTLTDEALILKGTTISGTAVPGIASYVDLSSTPIATVTKDTSASVAPGYYLIKDSAAVSGTDTYTLYIAKIADGTAIEISRKAASSVPTVTKTVNDVEVDDAAEGDTLTFKVVGTLPDNYASYSAYTYTLTDTFDTGITVDKSSVKVMAGTTDITSKCTVTVSGQVLTIACTDLKTAAPSLTKDSKITYTYTGALNASAVTAKAGNKNSAALTYSNDPNSTSVGTSSNSTPDTAVVRTYDLIINEKDENGDPLDGVTLTLYDSDNNIVGTAQTGSSAEWDNIDSGTYTLKTTVPTGYKAVDDKTFTITADLATPSLSVTDSIFDSVTANADTGVINATVNNYTKTSLPVTGAIGLVAIVAAAGLAGGAALVMRKKDED